MVISIRGCCGHFNLGVLWPFQSGNAVVIPIRGGRLQATIRHQKNMVAGGQLTNCSAVFNLFESGVAVAIATRGAVAIAAAGAVTIPARGA